jgi:DNA-binding CsgD family transcriptional regulator
MGEGGGTTRRIVGRDRERARLRAALAAAQSGEPRVVVVEGPPGIGKTSLVAAALGGDGHVLLTAGGDEAESDLDFGVVDQVLRSAGLDGYAIGGRAHPARDPLRVGARLVRLVDETALPQPLVVLVDDAQWSDRPSLLALTSAARRLRVDGVLLCLVCRTNGIDRLPPGLLGLADATGGRIELGPLDAPAIATLAADAYGRPLPDGPAERLSEHTAGNPLHTLALVDELDFDVVARGGPLPAPRSYAALVMSLMADHAAPAQDLAMALAVLGMRAPLADVAAVATVSDPLGAAEALAGHGLIELVGTVAERQLAFSHGLVRASIVDNLPPSRRAELHERAADVTSGDESLRHRLAAAHEPQPELVEAALARADHHAGSGSAAQAARLLLEAAPAAATPAEREELVVRAAGEMALAGVPLGSLADEIRGFGDSPRRDLVLARLAFASGALTEARALLDRAWDQARGDAGAGAVMGSAADLLAMLALDQRRWHEVVGWAQRALDAGSGSGISALLLAQGLVMAAGTDEAQRRMTELLAADPPAPLALDARLGRGVARLWANDLEGAESDLGDVAGAVLADGPLLARVDVDAYRAEAAYRAGRWREARDLAEATASIVDDAGETWLAALPHGVAAFVLAAQGDIDAARRHCESASASAEATGLFAARLWARHAATRLAVAAGHNAEVVALGDAMLDEGWDVPEGVHHWRAAYVESLVAVGRLDDALAVARSLGASAEATGDVSVAAGACRALGVAQSARGCEHAADAAFAAGFALDPATCRPFELARLELAAGAHFRRSARRRAAAELLARAAGRLDVLGARPWAERCAAEIAACGLRPRPRTATAEGGLTAQEQRVAGLVATGLTNREVAAELVISAKTVEHHLGRVYVKLGLRSRTELVAHLATGAGDAGR